MLFPPYLTLYRRFNPRAREGRDPPHLPKSISDDGFNPRAREGRDLVLPIVWTQMLVSIHAPARGATRGRQPFLEAPAVSIHAPARGATRGRQPFLEAPAVSIHAPARGATLDVVNGAFRTTMFQSTRPRGARLYLSSIFRFVEVCFNPRAREGRDLPSFVVVASTCMFQSTRPRGARHY